MRWQPRQCIRALFPVAILGVPGLASGSLRPVRCASCRVVNAEPPAIALEIPSERRYRLVRRSAPHRNLPWPAVPALRLFSIKRSIAHDFSSKPSLNKALVADKTSNLSATQANPRHGELV
jgi:hypothetical protein